MSREQRGAAALLAQTRGEALDAEQTADLEYLLDAICKQRLVKTVSSITRAEYTALAGINDNIYKQHANRLRLPIPLIRGGTISLCDILNRHHEIHSENGKKERANKGTPVSDAKAEKEKLEVELTRKRIEAAELDIQQKRGNFVDREELKLRSDWFIGRLRSIGQLLGKRCGAEAQQVMNDGMQSIREELLSK